METQPGERCQSKAALFLVPPDQVQFDPINELSKLPEVIREDLSEHAGASDARCWCIRMSQCVHPLRR